MATLEEAKNQFNKQLLKACPTLARQIRECASDEEASELLYSKLSEIFKINFDGIRELLDTRFPAGQERQSEPTRKNE